MTVIRVVGDSTVIRPSLRSLTEYVVGWGLVVAALAALPRPLDFGAVALGIPALLQLLRKTKTRIWLTADQLVVRSPSGDVGHAANELTDLSLSRGWDGMLRLGSPRVAGRRVTLPIPTGGPVWTRDRQVQTQAILDWWAEHRDEPRFEPRPARSWRNSDRG